MNGMKVDYVPTPIPQVTEVEQPKSYYAHKVGFVTWLLLAIIATIGGVCGSGHCGIGSDSPAAPVASAPTSHRSTFLPQMEAKLLNAFGEDYLDEENYWSGVRRQALDWIIHEDPLHLTSEADNFIQRYILALVYFQSSQMGPWNECDPSGPSLCYPTTWWGHDVGVSSAWLSGDHECFWASVGCEGTGNWMVTSISLCKFF
jgi:hypothetical protein